MQKRVNSHWIKHYTAPKQTNMTSIILHDESQGHKVLRKLTATRHSDKEAFASSFTEFTITKYPERFLSYAIFG